jgi:Rieske Fe-S protein
MGAGSGFLALGDDAAARGGPEREPPQIGDRFQVVGGGPLADQVVRPEHIDFNVSPLEAFAYEPEFGTLRRGSRLHRLLIVRVDPAEMDADTLAATADGVLVYSAVCTHKGCTVNGWLAEARRFRCPCHLSEFSVVEAGRAMDGPATRSLPFVPVGIDGEGFVVARDSFNRKPGFKG